MKDYSDYELPMELASVEAQRDPYPFWKEMRDEKPVRYDEDRGVWDVFRYEDVSEALTNYDLYSSEGTSHIGRHMLASDPPDHTVLRGMISDYFKAHYLDDFEAVIEDWAETFLTESFEDGRMDFIQDVTIPFPISVLTELMGIDQSKWPMYRGWLESLLQAPTEIDPEKIEETHRGRAETRREMREFFEAEVADREENPGDDIISTLVAQEDEVDFFDRELTLNTCSIVMIGGHVTTTQFLSNAMLAFIENDVFPALRSGEVEIGPALEEALRYYPPVSRLDRITTQEVELGGQTIPEGERLILWPSSANRDERVFDDPDEFDPHRDSTQPHVAFGRGVHTCVGNSLARREGRILFSEFIDRYEDPSLATDTLEPFFSTLVNGPAELPIEVEPKAASIESAGA